MSEGTVSGAPSEESSPLISSGSYEAGPVQPHQRIQLLDVLRGFALLGMVLVNWSDASNAVLQKLIAFFAEGSFYPMFSFLFGFGFALQLICAEEGKRPFVLRYLWRTAILYVIGASHYLLFWQGDIVRTYAQAALLLLFVRRWRPGLLLGLAAILFVFYMSPVYEFLRPGHAGARVDPEHAEAERLETQLSTARSQSKIGMFCDSIPVFSGRYREQLVMRVSYFSNPTSNLASLRWWMSWADVLCMFVLGLYAGRRRILHNPARHTRLLVWVAGIGLAFGLAGNGLDAYGDFFESRGIALPQALSDWGLTYSIGNIGLTFFYLSSLTLLFTHRRGAVKLLAPLASVGRMALTNYLMQSIFFMMIFPDSVSGIQITGWHLLLLINVFFVVQVLYSRWWLKRFRFGPVEWAWRSLTWWRLQPMLIVP